MTFTIIAGNFDLSLGSIFALSEVLGASAAVHWGVGWCFPVTIGAGAIMALINGLLVTKLRVNAFLATLASGLTFGGIAVGVTNGGLLITPSSSVFTFIGQHNGSATCSTPSSSSLSSRSCCSSCWRTPSSAATCTASATTATRPGCPASRSTGP